METVGRPRRLAGFSNPILYVDADCPLSSDSGPGSSLRSSRLSPGTLFYRIRAQEGEATGRFIILN